jgi:general secretion pathway protein D
MRFTSPSPIVFSQSKGWLSRLCALAALVGFASSLHAQTAGTTLQPRRTASAPTQVDVAPKSVPLAQTSSVPSTPPAANAAGIEMSQRSNPGVESALQKLAGSDRSSSYGSGIFIERASPLAPSRTPPADDPPVGFSFENGDLREIVRNVLGDLLNENFTIDPQVQGTVTIRTSKPVRRSEVFSLLESMLRANGFGIVRDGKYWRVGALANLSRGYGVPQISHRWLNGDRQGVNVAIYQAVQVGANELKRLVEPFAKDPAVTLRIDDVRNWLIITAPGSEMERLLEVATMFDASLINGMSFSMVTLKYAEVKAVVSEYERIFGATATNPLSGLLRIVPLERINALLVISPREEVVKDAERWIERLDQPGDPSGVQRLYVYTLQYTQAEKLQPILSQALSSRDPRSGLQAATVAPGQQAVTTSAPVAPIPGQGLVTPGNSPGTSLNNPQPQTARPGTGVTNQTTSGQSQQRGPTVVADKDRNSLLILSTPSEYSLIESVIKKLDIPPKQVAIEVKIAEVELTGEFSFGLETYFAGKFNDPRNRFSSTRDGFGTLIAKGFTYTWKKSDAIQAILKLSESKDQVRFLAQPVLITLENQKATFTAGKQISVRTQTQTGNTTTGTTDSFQYINTGITINVTPRVSGENVFLELQQEKSDSKPTQDGSNPDITRSATSTSVMVQSGDTMLLGGLFQDKNTSGSAGFPVLSTIPILGGLFGQTGTTSDRSEIVLLITPRIISSAEEGRLVVDELRKQLSGIENANWSASTRQQTPEKSEKTR